MFHPRSPLLAAASALLLASAIPGVPGRAVAEAARPLTLEQALELGRKNNRDLRASRVRLEQSAEGIRQAWATLLPTATAQGKYTHNYKDVSLDFSPLGKLLGSLGKLQGDLAGDVYAKLGAPASDAVRADLDAVAAAQQAGGSASLPSSAVTVQKQEQLDLALNVTVPLLVPSAYPLLTAARRTQSANQESYRAGEVGVLYPIAQPFFLAAGTDELLQARRAAIGVASQTVDNARARLRAGVATRVEVVRAEVALLRAGQAAVEAADAKERAYRALGTLLQLREPFRVLPGEQTPPASLPPDDGRIRRAIDLRPEREALRLGIDAARSQASASLWRWAPSVSGFGQVRAFNYTGFSGDPYAWAVGLELDWVLYDGGLRDAQRRLADALRRENEERLAAIEDTVGDEIRNGQRDLETRRRALETARRAFSLSQETLTLVRAQYEAGSSTQLDLLQAQDALVVADVVQAQARFDLALAGLTLRRAEGEFP
jgi:outer membrane protein TolC